MILENLIFGGLYSWLPALLLLARFLWRKPPWWVIVPLVIIVGWATYLSTVVDHFEGLQDLVDQTPNPSAELLDEAYSDGGPLVFAALFGWVVSLLYALPWYLLYLVAIGLRGAIRGRRHG